MRKLSAKLEWCFGEPGELSFLVRGREAARIAAGPEGTAAIRVFLRPDQMRRLMNAAGQWQESVAVEYCRGWLVFEEKGFKTLAAAQAAVMALLERAGVIRPDQARRLCQA